MAHRLENNKRNGTKSVIMETFAKDIPYIYSA